MNKINNRLLTTLLEKIDREELLLQFNSLYDHFLKEANPPVKDVLIMLDQREIIAIYIEFKIISYVSYDYLPLFEIKEHTQMIKIWVNYIANFQNRISEISVVTARLTNPCLMDRLLFFEKFLSKSHLSEKVNSLLKEELIVAPYRKNSFQKAYVKISNTVTTYSTRTCLAPLGNEERNIRGSR